MAFGDEFYGVSAVEREQNFGVGERGGGNGGCPTRLFQKKSFRAEVEVVL